MLRDPEDILFGMFSRIQASIYLIQSKFLPRRVQESPDRDTIFEHEFIPRLTYITSPTSHEIEGAKMDGEVLFCLKEETWRHLHQFRDVPATDIKSWIRSLQGLLLCLKTQHERDGEGAYFVHNYFLERYMRVDLPLEINPYGFKPCT